MVGVSSADIAPLPKKHTDILSFLKVFLRFSEMVFRVLVAIRFQPNPPDGISGGAIKS